MAARSFIGGAIILMLAGFIARILGFVYRIYLSNLIGAEGMGLFQLIAPIYSLIILTLTSGISISVSRLVAGEAAKGRGCSAGKITACALALVLSASVLVSLLMFVFLDPIVKYILHDARTYRSILLLIPCIPVISAASAVKGYFYGIQDVTPTAVSQVVEQIVRIGIVMVMAGWIAKAGLEYACALATAGMAFGEISNLAVLASVYAWKRRRGRRAAVGGNNGGWGRLRIMKELFKGAAPISANRLVTSAMSAAEFILIPGRLVASGLDYQHSMAEFGRLAGMAMPIFYFPLFVTSSLATTLVPAIAGAISIRKYSLANSRISRSVQITFILGIIFTSVFLCYPDTIGGAFYRHEKIGGMLYLLSFSSVFVYLQQTLLGVLNGLGKQGISLRNSIIGYAIRIAAVYFLIPAYGIRGYIWSIAASTGLVCIMNLAAVVGTTGLALDFRMWLVKPGLVGVFMYFCGGYISRLIEPHIHNAILATSAVTSAHLAVSALLMLSSGAISIGDLKKLMPVRKKRFSIEARDMRL